MPGISGFNLAHNRCQIVLVPAPSQNVHQSIIHPRLWENVLPVFHLLGNNLFLYSGHTRGCLWTSLSFLFFIPVLYPYFNATNRLFLRMKCCYLHSVSTWQLTYRTLCRHYRVIINHRQWICITCVKRHVLLMTRKTTTDSGRYLI